MMHEVADKNTTDERIRETAAVIQRWVAGNFGSAELERQKDTMLAGMGSNKQRSEAVLIGYGAFLSMNREIDDSPLTHTPPRSIGELAIAA